jgi:hypothetical protein
MSIQEKIQHKINSECEYADREGASRFSVCNHSNWDRDLWTYRQDMIDAIIKRGYSVVASIRWGVTDIEIRKPIKFY